MDWFWRLRGRLDQARGGDGLRRGRRDPDDLQVGDRIDCWRVERLEPGRQLLLAAEMKLPGRLWLQFEVDPGPSGTQLRQTTVFDPAGYVGLLYWHLLFPIHHVIFAAMLRGLRRATAAWGTTPRVSAPGCDGAPLGSGIDAPTPKPDVANRVGKESSGVGV